MTGIGDAASAHWTEVATVGIGRIGPPLEPAPEDIAAFELAASGWGPGDPALLLGMTRAVATMRWPANSRLIAIDSAEGAVRSFVSLGPPPIPARALVADWRRMPLQGHSVAYALGDGSYNCVESAAAQNDVSAELLRVLRPGGGLALRVYVRPERPEKPEHVFDDLLSGKIGRFTVFKLRLLMATPAQDDGSVRLSDTWELWAAHNIDRAALAAATGWRRETIDTINAYRGKPVRYVFHTLAGTRARLAPFFVETGMIEKTYELGRSFPTLILQRR